MAVASPTDRTGALTPKEDRVTKKHFEAFARVIAASDNDLVAKTFAALVIVRVASEDNPRFDRDRFMKACGL